MRLCLQSDPSDLSDSSDRADRSDTASILVGVLWCMALLSVIVISVLHLSRMDLMVVKNYGDQVQAHYLAVAGIEKAKALLYQDARERSRSAVSHNGRLYDAPEQLRDVRFGRGQFSVLRRARPDEGGAILYGVSDEQSLLNVNQASNEELAKLEGMTPDVIAAIIDWRDADNEVTPGGAEADYYMSLRPPYMPRNGPLQTIREMLMIRGISRDLLLGRDFHQNGLLEASDEARLADGARQPGHRLGRTLDGQFLGGKCQCRRDRPGEHPERRRGLADRRQGNHPGHRQSYCRLARPKPFFKHRRPAGRDRPAAKQQQ